VLTLNRNKNETFKCKISIKGAGDNPKRQMRLILSPESSKTKIFFEGIYKNNECFIEIPPISDSFLNRGDVILEVIANNTVFQPWKDKFEILSESVIVENVELINNDQQIIIEVETNKKLFKPNLNSKSKKEVKECLKKIKNINNKNKLIREIKEFKPNKQTLNWAKNIFENINSQRAKLLMYFKQKL